MTEQGRPVVKLIGEDGNVFNVIGRTARALRRAGMRQEAEEFVQKATSSRSYDEVLALTMEYCSVE